MFHVYGDESSDETKSRVFAVAGVIGPEDLWSAIEAKWLARTGGIPFHSKDCESDQGDYKSISHAENQVLYRDLTTLLVESGLCGWGFVMDLSAQREVFPDAPDIAYYKGFLEVVTAMANFANVYQQPLQFTFDKRTESNYNSAYLYKMFAEQREITGDLPQDIRFACSKLEPRLQVADLWTREVMKAMDNWVGPIKRVKRKSWAALEATNRFAIDAISIDWFRSLESQMSQLQAEAGMEPQKYLLWLHENKLVDSTTNKFRFFESTIKRSMTET